MLDFSRDIQSLTDFKKNTSEFINQLKETGEPVVLTINGKAELVVQDAAAYQKLRQIAEEARLRRRHPPGHRGHECGPHRQPRRIQGTRPYQARNQGRDLSPPRHRLSRGRVRMTRHETTLKVADKYRSEGYSVREAGATGVVPHGDQTTCATGLT